MFAASEPLFEGFCPCFFLLFSAPSGSPSDTQTHLQRYIQCLIGEQCESFKRNVKLE